MPDVALEYHEVPPGLLLIIGVANELAQQSLCCLALRQDHVVVSLVIGFAFDNPVRAFGVVDDEVWDVVMFR